MPYTTQWLVDKRIIATRIAQNISPEKKEAKDDVINQLLAQSEKQTAHLVLDCSDLNYPSFRSWRWTQNKHLGWVVIYGIHNPLMEKAMRLGFQFLGIRAQFVHNQDAALAFLQEVDITLPKMHIA